MDFLTDNLCPDIIGIISDYVNKYPILYTAALLHNAVVEQQKEDPEVIPPSIEVIYDLLVEIFGVTLEDMKREHSFNFEVKIFGARLYMASHSYGDQSLPIIVRRHQYIWDFYDPMISHVRRLVARRFHDRGYIQTYDKTFVSYIQERYVNTRDLQATSEIFDIENDNRYLVLYLDYVYDQYDDIIT